MLFTLSILIFSLAFGKTYSDKHWSIKTIEKINHTKSLGLIAGNYKLSVYKKYKEPSGYLTALYYTDGDDKHYIAVSIIDEKSKNIVSSQLLPVLQKPKRIYFDINNYNFISKKLVFGLIVASELSFSSIAFYDENTLFLYSYDNSSMKLLVSNLKLDTENIWTDGWCISDYVKRTIQLKNKKYTREYPKLSFKGEVEEGKSIPVKGDLSKCSKTYVKKNGKYKITLEYKNNKYKITNKSVYIDNNFFKSLYRISKFIKKDVQSIIDINPRLNVSKLRISEEISIPIDNERL